MKRKWLAIGLGLGTFAVLISGVAVWFATVSLWNWKEQVQNKWDAVQSWDQTQCAETVKGLLSSEAWLIRPPSDNLQKLKDSCAPEPIEDSSSRSV